MASVQLLTHYFREEVTTPVVAVMVVVMEAARGGIAQVAAAEVDEQEPGTGAGTVFDDKLYILRVQVV